MENSDAMRRENAKAWQQSRRSPSFETPLRGSSG